MPIRRRLRWAKVFYNLCNESWDLQGALFLIVFDEMSWLWMLYLTLFLWLSPFMCAGYCFGSYYYCVHSSKMWIVSTFIQQTFSQTYLPNINIIHAATNFNYRTFTRDIPPHTIVPRNRQHASKINFFDTYWKQLQYPAWWQVLANSFHKTEKIYKICLQTNLIIYYHLLSCIS